MRNYHQGQTIPCYCLFVDRITAAIYTPTAVTFAFTKKDSGDVTLHTFGVDADITNEELPASVLAELLPIGIDEPGDETGQFIAYFTPPEAGVWMYRFDGNGGAAKESAVRVLEAQAIP